RPSSEHLPEGAADGCLRVLGDWQWERPVVVHGAQRATADDILEVRNQRSGVEGLEHAWRLRQAGWARQAGHERVGGGEERPSGERHAAAERAASEAPAGIAARPEGAGP